MIWVILFLDPVPTDYFPSTLNHVLLFIFSVKKTAIIQYFTSVTPPLSAVHHFSFTHSCLHCDGRSCRAMRLLLLTSNLGFSFLLKGTCTRRQSDNSLVGIDPVSRPSDRATTATISRAPLLRCQLPSQLHSDSDLSSQLMIFIQINSDEYLHPMKPLSQPLVTTSGF